MDEIQCNARQVEINQMTKAQVVELAKATVRPGFEDCGDHRRTVWGVMGSRAAKAELALHIARVEILGY